MKQSTRAKRVLNSFLEHRHWSREYTTDDFDGVSQGFDSRTNPTITIERPRNHDFRMPFRFFNLFTLTVFEYETVLEFLGNYCLDMEFQRAHANMGIEDWRAIEVEEATGHSPILRQTTIETVAELWNTCGSMTVGNPKRYVDVYETVLRRNAHRFRSLEVGPMNPGDRSVFRGRGDPFRVVSK